jgi:lysophospholipase L1-like esterase
MKFTSAVTAVVLALAGNLAVGQNPASAPGASNASRPLSGQELHFRDRVASFTKTINDHPPTTETVVLLGDSITEGLNVAQLAGYPVMNEGVSGDRIENPETHTGIRNRLDLVAKARPAVVAVLIGINDFWGNGKDVATVEQEFRATLPELRAAVPNARIVVQSILPTRVPDKSLQTKVDEMNRKLPAIVASIKGEFLLLDPVMKAADNEIRQEYTTDGIHLTPAGNDAWVKTLERFLANSRQ